MRRSKRRGDIMRKITKTHTGIIVSDTDLRRGKQDDT